MSVIVKGVKMPENCCQCMNSGLRIAIKCTEWTEISAGRRETERSWSCPLGVLPDKHGRLVDADEILVSQEECNNTSSCLKCRAHVSCCADMEEIIRNATTIVEAEDGE